MPADLTFPEPASFSDHLRRLRASRQARVASTRASRLPRKPLTRPEREQILLKADGRCHICGGTIDGEAWDADHVFAHSAGGAHSIENYLPAHSLCNNYRWHYDTEEFQWILKLGVWLRTHIENKTTLGVQASSQFTAHENRRVKRRTNNAPTRPR